MRKGDAKSNMLFIRSLGCKIYFLPIALKVYDVVVVFFSNYRVIKEATSIAVGKISKKGHKHNCKYD